MNQCFKKNLFKNCFELQNGLDFLGKQIRSTSNERIRWMYLMATSVFP